MKRASEVIAETFGFDINEWIINKDQFFAQKENTILWKCSSL